VKGLVHPSDRIVAFPRYIPSAEGTRGTPGDLYRKVYNLAERFQYLQKNAPHLIVDDEVFGERLCEVPVNTVKEHYDPIAKLQDLRESKNLQPLQQKAVMLAEELKEAAGIPWSSIGISGSVMVDLFTLQSDIDPLVYGERNCRRAYDALLSLVQKGKSKFKAYTREELAALFDFRSKDTVMSFEDFVRVESRKAFQGKYEGVDYFVRFVKDWNEVHERYGDVCYEKVGYAKLSATVVDDSEALFTPCSYLIEKVEIMDGPAGDSVEEIVSFRGRFCKQALKGERVKVQGKVERVTDKRRGTIHRRVIIGNQPSDYMVVLKT
jgi:predicted nucleotidyltransferase